MVKGKGDLDLELPLYPRYRTLTRSRIRIGILGDLPYPCEWSTRVGEVTQYASRW